MIEFRLLGSVDLKGSEGETLRSVLAQPKRVALLAYLAVAAPNGFHRRDKLLGLFWPESDQERGRGALRKALYFLRQSLGEEVIVSRGDEEIGLAEDTVWCDAVAFEEALGAGKPEEALELYRGDLLEGFFIAESPEFERWLEGVRERLRRKAGEAAWTLAERNEAEENGVQAASWARRALGFAPDDEGTLRRLLELLDRVGDRAAAVKEYEAFTRRLRDEYEAEPSPETQALIAAIREREVAAAGGGPERNVESQAGEERATAEPVTDGPVREPRTEPRPLSLLRVVSTYAVVSLAVLVAVHIFTLQLGLPDWFFPSAVVVLLVCLPIIVATALVQGAAIAARRGDAEAKPPPRAHRWLTWRNATAVTVAAFALLGLAVAGYMAMRVMGIGPWGTLMAKGVLEGRDLLVLADFEDHTNDNLAHTVTGAFRVRLEQSVVVTVADDDYVSRVLRRMERDPDAPLTYDLAREVAIREGLKAVVTGEVNPAGSGYVLLSRLVAAETGETLASFLETAADPDAIIDAIDRLSGQVRERIGESLKSVRGSPPLSETRTASLEALRLYTEAYDANVRGDRTDALDLLNRAIEIDTTFAAAYRLRVSVRNNLWMDVSLRVADATRAYELRHGLPLWEQYSIEATYHATVTGDREKDLAASRALLRLRPNRGGTFSNLAVHYGLWQRDYAKAEEMSRRRIEIDSLAAVSWGHLRGALVNQGKYEEAEETLQQWEAQLGRSLPGARAGFACALGDYGAAERYFAQIGNSPVTDRRKARLAQVQGKLAEAEGYFVDAMAGHEEGGRATGYLWTALELAGLRVWCEGDTARARQTVAGALEKYPLDSIHPLDRPYSGLAGFYGFAGEPERARELLVEWESVVPPDLRGTREVERRAAWGAVALAEGNVEEALRHFRFVNERSFSPISGLPQLGRAHELGGQPDSAVALYERYLTTPFAGRTLSGTSAGWSRTRAGQSPELGWDPYWLPVVYERLGDLYEQRGDTAKAIYYYGKLVDLWKDADPELQPRVEAARRAMEALSPDT